MLKKNIGFIILMGLSMLNAQTYSILPKKLISSSNKSLVDQSNINILAILVEFQEDDFDLTYGDGTFGSIYSQDYGNDILDPLPHDAAYFESHLKFAENYFRKVSNEKANISFTVLPKVLKLSKPMREYSPTADESFLKLADFAKESWTLANNEYTSFDFSQYDLFMIFHAGVGKDISTTSYFGEARDLPSIYLSFDKLKELYGETFSGFQLNDGTLVTNSIVLPETESREEDGIGGTALLELTINGLIVSSIASHMGLPDLFDSETGISAIGRFGLMDGQSLFSFRGLFPPEPSAWEKIYLGWEVPGEIHTDVSNIPVSAARALSNSYVKIIKVPINSTEYYLIENRARDANKDGATITYKVGGQLRTINFSEDLDNFNNYLVDTIKGVVIDIDEYDWALPGNGILIWHIDEKIINEGLASNKVNVFPNRGVDLEEADGIQDIGETFQTIFGDIVYGEGEDVDFWFSGNKTDLYQNLFSENTKPNSNTNSGSKSLITLSNFSELGNEMTFDLKFGNEDLNYIGEFRLRQIPENTNFISYKAFADSNYFSCALADNGTLYRMMPNAGLASPLENFSKNEVLIVNTENYNIIVGTFNNSIKVAYQYYDKLFSGQTTIIKWIEINNANFTSAPILVSQSDNDLVVMAGLDNGSIEQYKIDLNQVIEPNLVETKNISTNPIQFLSLIDEKIIIGTSNTIFNFDENIAEFNSNIKQSITTKNKKAELISIILTEDNKIYTLNYESKLKQLIFSSESVIDAISIGDIKNDGENYIVFNQNNQINVINLAGNFADNFPYTNNNSTNFTGYNLIADIDEDNNSDVIAVTEDGNIFAISGNDGNLLKEFPLSVGDQFTNSIAMVAKDGKQFLSAGNDKDDFYYWEINSSGRIDWGSFNGDNYNSSSLSSASTENLISTFFPKNRTYNWPNPVYNNETNIRTFVNEDSDVNVKVFDLAGDLVDEFSFTAVGGIDSEKSWDVSNVQSGAYFAHVEVKSKSGRTESKIIKIAIIK